MATEEIKEEKTEAETEEVQNEACQDETEKENTKVKDDKKSPKQKKDKSSKEIDKLKEELAEQKEKYLRIAAEYENYRRRATEEKDRAYGDAYAAALGEILPCMDNLDRAVTYSSGDAEQFAKGVEMTLNQFKQVLEKLGIEEIPAERGSEFDPNLHNAVMTADDPELQSGQIATVLQKGYKKGEKIIRHTMVQVAN